MKPFRVIAILVTCFLLMPAAPPALAQFSNILKSIQKSITPGTSLSTDEIVRGLKEALAIGSKKAVSSVSVADGYFGNPRIKIPLPASVQRVENVLRGVGYGHKVDAFELSMNRAAEQAATGATALFIDAIRQMTIQDAKGILQGVDDAATRYLEDKTRDSLGSRFKPVVHDAMSDVGVTRVYQQIDTKLSNIPFVSSLDFDLDRYVTDAALNGLFLMLAEEESKIRKDPTARVTDLLQKVFGQ